MKATDFNLAKDLKFNLETGLTTFKSNRLVILDTNAMGLLGQKLLENLGWDKAREVFLKFGYQNGYADFLQMKLAYTFDSEMDLLASGPVIHTWEGHGAATPSECRFDRSTGEFFFTGVSANSYEAEQFLCFNAPAAEPVCWSLVGYASGWCTAFFGKRLLALEPRCVGKGDDHCEWKIQPESAWGKEAAPYVEAYKEFPV
jgi:hypothetical protein